MDRRVAQGASLILLCLVMEAWRSRCAGARGQGMAAYAQQVYLILLEHALICRTVRRMARLATFDFGFVLIHERPLLVSVALIANLVLANRGAELVPLKSAMGVVAIVALHQTFVYSMMERPSELRPDIHVAAVAELWGRLFKQVVAFPGVVRGMAVDARDSALQMRGTAIVALLVAVLMTIQTTGTNLRG